MNYRTLADLEKDLGLDRATIRRYCLKRGIRMNRMRTADTNGQLAYVLDDDAVEAFRRARLSDGYGQPLAAE